MFISAVLQFSDGQLSPLVYHIKMLRSSVSREALTEALGICDDPCTSPNTLNLRTPICGER